MENQGRLTVIEKLVLAAYEAAQEKESAFSAEDLVVAAWRMFPDTFGLAGYRDTKGNLLYPDSNRVFAEIMGSKPIRKRGLLVKVGRKMYQLTEAGREHAHLLLARSGDSSIEKAGLPREITKELKRLFASKAVEKVKFGRLADVTFYDACAFWGISPRSSAIEMQGRFARFGAVTGAARSAVDGKEVAFEHGGSAFGTKDIDALENVHADLLKRFRTEIDVIGKRKDERA